MNKKQILIILITIILAVVACLTAYTLVHSQEETYMTFRISNSCTVEVPVSNNTVEHIDGGINKYSFDYKDLNITHQKTENNSEIKSIKDSQIESCELIEDNIYYNQSTGIYSIFIENNETGDALLITSSDLDLLKKVSSSIKFKNPLSSDTNENNTTSDENTTIDESVEEVQNEQVDSSQNYQNSNTSAQSNENEAEKEESKYPSVILG